MRGWFFGSYLRFPDFISLFIYLFFELFVLFYFRFWFFGWYSLFEKLNDINEGEVRFVSLVRIKKKKKRNWIIRREEWDKKGLSSSSAKLDKNSVEESCFSTSWLNIHSHWSETLVAYKQNKTEHRPFTTARQTIYSWQTLWSRDG